jgi:hypothetical protein
MPAELSRTRESLEAMLNINRLLALDDLWTAYLDHADPPDIDRDLPGLESIVGEMSERITVARRDLVTADEQLQGASDRDVARALEALLPATPEDAAFRAHFSQSLSELGPRRSLMFACRYFDLGADDEIRELNAKLGRLRSGGFERGDMDHKMKCALDLGGVAVGVGSCVLAFPVGCLAIAGAVLLVARGWDDGCGPTLWEFVDRVRDAGAEPPEAPDAAEPA